MYVHHAVIIVGTCKLSLLWRKMQSLYIARMERSMWRGALFQIQVWCVRNSIQKESFNWHRPTRQNSFLTLSVMSENTKSKELLATWKMTSRNYIWALGIS